MSGRQEHRGSVAFAICGAKDSGKTTLITRLIPLLAARGLRVVTIKHDGHDFVGDVPGTDSYRHREAGAVGTAILSQSHWLVQGMGAQDERSLMSILPAADLVLLEGFKASAYPKLEVVRGAGAASCCNPKNLVAVASDTDCAHPAGVARLGLDDVEALARVVLAFWGHAREGTPQAVTAAREQAGKEELR
ncbi:molybdopterin-guanine dinucleotide biosynthesis protein B [Olsenella profusa]|uniref:molybdopterin-guanine dinucleotide biosynthesis protein B n=1 Tax=Olsenella profusa TaxID=138595 RepID=UPI0018DD7DE4|nr:molybdopterin-guanine dinucleotide biosynthesis protein B [Olsenella profusa]